MAKVLITGASGFIGEATVKAFEESDKIESITTLGRTNVPKNKKGYHLFCDLLDFSALQSCCKYINPDIVIHLAGNPYTRYNPDNPFAVVRTNINGTQNLIEALPRKCRFLYASSVSVYGNEAGKWNADMVESGPTKPTNIYGTTKLACENLVANYTLLNKIDGVSLRYIAQVGKHPTHGAFKDIFNKIMDSSPDLTLLGSRPGSIKPYMYVHDTASATLHLATKEILYHSAYNVATTGNLSIENLAQTMMMVCNKGKKIVWAGEESKFVGDNPVMNISSFYLEMEGWTPKYKTSCDAIIQATKDML